MGFADALLKSVVNTGGQASQPAAQQGKSFVDKIIGDSIAKEARQNQGPISATNLPYMDNGPRFAQAAMNAAPKKSSSARKEEKKEEQEKTPGTNAPEKDTNGGLNIDMESVNDFMSRPLGAGLAEEWNKVAQETGWDTGPISSDAPTGTKTDGEPSDWSQNSEFGLAHNWAPESQMDQYYDWLDTDAGKAFLEKYGDQYGRDTQGYTNLRASQNRDMWSDVMGYGDIEGINGWQDLYAGSGVDLSDENAMDNMMEYLYGANAIDLDRSLANEGWLDPRVGQNIDAYDEATLWYGLQHPEVIAALNESAGIKEGDEQLDANDLAYLALASRLGNMGYGDNFLNELNRAAEAAGQAEKFGFTDDNMLGYLGDDGKFYAPDGTKYSSPRSGGYNLTSNMQLNPYQGLIDQYMVDTILDMYNAGSKNPEAEAPEWVQNSQT